MIPTSHTFQALSTALDRQAAERADHLALRFLHDGEISGRTTELTYAAFRARALEVAAALQDCARPGDRALLLYEGGVDYITAFFGCLYAGVIAVPTYPPDPQRLHRTLPRLQAIAEDAGAKLVLCSAELERVAGPLCAQAGRLRELRWLSTDTLTSRSGSWRPHTARPDDIAYLQYTSGSTGTPKGVIVTHDSLAWTCADMFARFSYEGECHQVSWLPTFHDLGLIWGLLTPLLSGFPVTFMLPTVFLQRPARWLAAVSHFRATHTAAPNFAYDLCVSKFPAELLSQLDLSSLRAAMNAAEPVRPSTLDAFLRKFGPVGFREGAWCPCYGLAEATLQVTINPPGAPPTRLPVSVRALEEHRVVSPVDHADTRILVGCGPLLPAHRLAIVAPDTHHRLGERQVGEIWTAGPNVGRGYWERPEATAESFDLRIPGEDGSRWLNTGDLGFVSDGQLFISGRAKDVLIIRGRNVYPQDLEEEIERVHPAVRRGCVAAFAMEMDGQEQVCLVAEIEPARLAGASPESLLRPMRMAVAESFDIQLHDLALIPPRGIFKTSSGKVQRRRTRTALQAGELTVLARWTAPQRPAAPAMAAMAATELTVADLAAWVVGQLMELPNLVLPEGPISDVPFPELGLDSASAVGISGKLSELLGRSLPATLLFEHQTVRAVVAHLQRGPAAERDRTRQVVGSESSVDPSEAIAIIGTACRLPGAVHTSDALFALLERGTDAVGRIPPERWSDLGSLTAAPALQWAALLERVDQFDASFFGISPREANMLDPQQRLLLEMVWEALEDAGQHRNRLAGGNTGVFIGLSTTDYMHAVRSSGTVDVHTLTGTIASTAAGRISHAYGLCGPCMTVDTACSSSLVAVHLACQSLRMGESDLAIVGGVNLILAPDVMYMLSKSQALSPDGRSKTFDADANGYVRGEGGGVVVLKRLSAARRDGDPILACIRGSATNHNAGASGLTVPSVAAQQSLVRQALANARVAADEVDYIETHGTGTALGDPMEFEALRVVLGAPNQAGTRCVLGALKTNLGHLEAAAGIAGLLKVVACLQHGAIPRNLHLTALNPRIQLHGTRFLLPDATIPWPAGGRPRRAGVSSFGLSGTNAHVVVEEAPARPVRPATSGGMPARSYVLSLSAKSDAALRLRAQALADALRKKAVPLSDLAYTSCCRRTHLDHRLAAIGDSSEELARLLQEYVRGERSPAVLHGHAGGSIPQVVLVFSGQGSQWSGMGRALLRQSAVFRKAVEQCSRQMVQLGGFSIAEELERPDGASALHRTEVAQPALFAVQVGLLAELRSFGIEPALVLGHSVGEVAAAYAAGILPLEAACALVLARARAMIELAGKGKMVAVELNEEEAEAARGGEAALVSVAAVNGPRSVVLSGETAALERVLVPLRQRGVVCRDLGVDYAFHSPQMDEAERQFLGTVAPLAPGRGNIPMLSTLTATELQGPELTAAYWGRNIRQPVRFTEAIAQALQRSGRLFLEVGPHPVLCAELAAQLAAAGYAGAAIPSLRRNKDERTQLLTALAALHVRGVPVRWGADFSASEQVVALPPYPWQRERFWFSTPGARPPPPRIASDYYDSVTRIVQTTQAQHPAEQAPGLYLTFAPFAQVVPGFSWLESFAHPEEHPHFLRLLQQQQLELRQVLFRHVDFSSCTRVLDFGCGMSRDLLRLAQQYDHLQLDGYTISAGQAEFGQKLLAEHALGQRARVYCRDSARDSFPDQYDLIFGFEVAHHIKDKAALFANIGQHLQPGGTLVLADFLANTAFEIEHDASSSFFLTVEQWTEVLSERRLQIHDVVDVSRQIANFLHDPQFDARLAKMRQAGEDDNVLTSFQSYDRLGKMFDRGLASYILLSANRVDGKSVAELQEHNRAALRNLLPYVSESAEKTAEGQLLYAVDWRRAALPATSDPGDGWLLVAREAATAVPLAQRLTERGARCVRVLAGRGYAPVAPDCYQMPLSTTSLRRLLAEAFGPEKPCARVVYLGALDVPEPEGAAEMGAAVADLCSEATNLAQALVTHGFRTVPRLYLVTQGAQAVAASDSVRVAQAPLIGLGKTIALEHPELRCMRLDLDPASPVDADALLREVRAADREDQVALRGGQRFVARLVRAPLAAGKAPAGGHSIRGDRSYLITGGVGGLGLTVARWLLGEGAGLVFLANRHEPGEAGRQQLRALQEAGDRVHSVQVDVTQESQVRLLLSQVAQSGKPLAGVVHAAGVLLDKVLLEQTRESFHEVMAPKVMGAWNLHRLLDEAELDFFVMYSSAAALCGSPGQGNYGAANAFLDALAQQRRQQGKKATSIQWGAFSEVGMAARDHHRSKRVAALGMAGLTPAEGLTLLHKLLVGPVATVGVMRLDARQWIESMPSAASLPFFSDLVKAASGSKHPGWSSRRMHEMLERLRRTPEPERFALMIEYTSEELGAVLQIAPSRLDPRAPFRSLGVDSLMSLEVRNRLEARLGLRLEATVLYTYGNLDALVAFLLGRLGLAPDAAQKVGTASASRKLDAIAAAPIGTRPDSLRQIDALSDEELARMSESLLD